MSSLVTLVISLVAFRMWYRKKIAKSKGPVHVKQMLSVHAASSRANVEHNDEISTVDRETERKDMTEYQKLEEREISKTPDPYQTIRVL